MARLPDHLIAAAFFSEVQRRGYQAVENGRHFVVFCNRLAIRRVR